MSVGLEVGGKLINLGQLEAELSAGGAPIPNGLTLHGPPHPEPVPFGQPAVLPVGTLLFTHDDAGTPADLPRGAWTIVAAHQSAPPPERWRVRTLRALEGARSLGELQVALVAAFSAPDAPN